VSYLANDTTIHNSKHGKGVIYSCVRYLLSAFRCKGYEPVTTLYMLFQTEPEARFDDDFFMMISDFYHQSTTEVALQWIRDIGL
jgi:hypothetical protein